MKLSQKVRHHVFFRDAVYSMTYTVISQQLTSGKMFPDDECMPISLPPPYPAGTVSQLASHYICSEWI